MVHSCISNPTVPQLEDLVLQEVEWSLYDENKDYGTAVLLGLPTLQPTVVDAVQFSAHLGSAGKVWDSGELRFRVLGLLQLGFRDMGS